MNVYDESGKKTGEKPYWGSGSKDNPYRDYPDNQGATKPSSSATTSTKVKNEPSNNTASGKTPGVSAAAPPPPANTSKRSSSPPAASKSSALSATKPNTVGPTADTKKPGTTFTTPTSAFDANSRLKSAREGLEYYTNGNGQFVTDRAAQIDKIRREIGFLESFNKSGSATATPPLTSTSKPPSLPATATASSSVKPASVSSATMAQTPRPATVASQPPAKNTAATGATASSPPGSVRPDPDIQRGLENARSNPPKDLEALRKTFWNNRSALQNRINQLQEQNAHVAGDRAIKASQLRSFQEKLENLQVTGPDITKAGLPKYADYEKVMESTRQNISRLQNEIGKLDETMRLRNNDIQTLAKQQLELARYLGSMEGLAR